MNAEPLSSVQIGIDGLHRRRLLLAGAGLGLQAALTSVALHAAEVMPGPLREAATPTARAPRSVLTRVVRAGERLVAMGERGLVVLSDDGGRQWRQARVPVSVTLTAASFADARQGWMSGHSGVVLHTTDGGETWGLQTDGIALAQAALDQSESLPQADTGRGRSIQRAKRLVDDGADKPLLSIRFADTQRGMAVGAYGLAAITDDGGETWAPCLDRMPNPRGMHLNTVVHHEKTWLIGGEQGVLMRSGDDRASFDPLASPFKRSFFAATTTRKGGFVIAGLLGNACRIEPGSTEVATAELPAPFTILSCVELNDGRVMLLAQGGRLLVSSDGGARYTEQKPPLRAPLTSLAEAADGGLVATSLSGVARLA
ncbi:MAG: YCF48-related protein [Rubrivivax sp.]